MRSLNLDLPEDLEEDNSGRVYLPIQGSRNRDYLRLFKAQHYSISAKPGEHLAELNSLPNYSLKVVRKTFLAKILQHLCGLPLNTWETDCKAGIICDIDSLFQHQ